KRAAFAAKLLPGGHAIQYCRPIVADSSGVVRIAADTSGNAYVVGTTSSALLSTLPALSSRRGGLDVFVATLSSGGDLQRVTFLGGTGDEDASDVAVDANRYIYVTGGTRSANFPT